MPGYCGDGRPDVQGDDEGMYCRVCRVDLTDWEREELEQDLYFPAPQCEACQLKAEEQEILEARGEMYANG
jgi:hypothetical protein